MGLKTHSINPLQPCIPQNIKAQIAPTLDPAIAHPIARVREGEILFVDAEFFIAHYSEKRGVSKVAIEG